MQLLVAEVRFLRCAQNDIGKRTFLAVGTASSTVLSFPIKCKKGALQFKQRAFGLSFTNKFFSALGAGDGDLALAPGNADGLTAAGAAVIPMLSVLQLLQKHEISSILLISLIGVPGQRTEDRPTHQSIG